MVSSHHCRVIIYSYFTAANHWCSITSDFAIKLNDEAHSKFHLCVGAHNKFHLSVGATDMQLLLNITCVGCHLRLTTRRNNIMISTNNMLSMASATRYSIILINYTEH